MTSDAGFGNQTLRLLLERASCRHYSQEKVPPEVLRQILEAGIHAPTAGNLQPYSIIKIENPHTKARLADLAGRQGFVAAAPVNLLFCIDWQRLQRWAEIEAAPFTATSSFRHFWLSFQDTIICAQNVCTAADALGLGSVYVGTIMESVFQVRELLQLPPGVFPVVLLCLGYPASRSQPARKLGVDVVVHEEVYQQREDEETAAAFDEKYAGREREVTVQRTENIAEVCREVHGTEFAERCLERIRQRGYISPAQTYFGLHYRANALPLGNEEFLRTMEQAGFGWFKKYRPPHRGATD